jgi:murein DD-endopeptidase MepM/ murein hydrolase activator NlpD
VSDVWTFPLPLQSGDRQPVISDGWHDGDPRVHHGVDLGYRRLPSEPAELPYGTKGFYNPPGTLALAANEGRVSISEVIGTGGYVKIWHPGDWATQYMHLAARYVAKGDVVRAGQPIGLVGHNPKGYGWNHLHFELLEPGGQKIDPAARMKEWRKVAPPANVAGLVALLALVVVLVV